MKRRSDIVALAKAEEGVPLWGCIPGSPAARAGLRYGDIVLFVNGVRTKDVADYLRAKEEGDGELEVVVRRDGETLTFTLELDRKSKKLVAFSRPSSAANGLPMLMKRSSLKN